MRLLLATLASLVAPGYGHGAVGRTRIAIAWAAVVPIAMLLVFVSMWMFYVAIALRVAAAVHTFVCARRAEQFAWTATPAIAVALAGLVSFAAIRQYVLEGYRMPTSSMYPTLVIGDHVFVDHVSRFMHPPRRGDVVVFAYPCYPRQTYVKRVIALGGDTVEVRCGVTYVNGIAAAHTLVAASESYRDYDETRATWVPRACSRFHETLDGTGYDIFHDAEFPTRGDAPDAHDFPQRDKLVLPSCNNAHMLDSLGDGPPATGKLVETKPAANARPCEPQYHYVIPDGMMFVMGDNRYNSADSRLWGPVSLSALHGRVLGIWLTDGADGVTWSRVGPL